MRSLDENQKVTRAYDAACTPEFYVFDSDLTLGGKPWEGIQKPGLGCGIKWK